MKKFSWDQYTFKIIRILLQGMLFFFAVYFFVLSPGKVNGSSMETQWTDDQTFFVNHARSFFSTPRRFQVVQFFDLFDHQRLLIKRVIGLPGETVSIRQNRIFIRDRGGNEVMLSEPFLASTTYTTVQTGQVNEITVPDHSYYVMGDNRLFSTDSRSFGPVPKELITGILLE